ncbi:MAG: c-type cytochrome [Ignavibacteriaceae bacterium]
MPNLEQYYRKKLDELKAQPVKIFALVYPYVLVVGLIIGLVYVNNLSQVARVTVPPGIPDTTAQTDLKVVEPRTVPPTDIIAASQPAAELIQKGEQLYATVCQSCHGADGQGSGPGATGLNPPPRNFTIAEGWKNGPKISQIYKTLEEGIPGTSMVAYDYLLPEEKIALAHYLRQTFIANAPKDTQDELVLLDQTYQLSKGQVISAQIPVSAALNIISKENADKVQQIVNALGQISEESNNEGAIIFNRVTTNKAKALTTVKNSASFNQQQLISLIVNDVNQNGFNGNVYKLNSQEWNTLYNYVSKFFPQGTSLQ